MSTKLIELDDGILVEVEVDSDHAQAISGGLAQKVSSSFNKIKPLLKNVCKPITETWNELNKEMNVEQAEIQVSLSFESEGNLYIAKSKAGANLSVKLLLKPKE